MNKIYFENHQQIILNALTESQKSVLIAVAWINFELYEYIFRELVTRKVKIKIIVNDDVANNRHKECINRLVEVGVKIKKIRMLNKSNYMHHKFCIIDGEKMLIGSYNWSKNASSNFENLMVLDDKNIIKGAKVEFNYIWKLSKETLKLQKKLKCRNCSGFKYNIMILAESGDHTSYKIVSICNCDGFEELKTDFLDIRLYNSIIGIIDLYNEQIERIKGYSEQIEILVSECDYDLLNIYSLLQADYHIHGIGIIGYEITSPDGDGEWFTNIIWRDRFANNLDEKYYETFNLL